MPRARKPVNSAPKAQRVDLQQSKAPIPAAGNNLPYGQKQQIQQAVAVAPLAEQPPVPDPLAAAMTAPPPPEGGIARPTERPTQPVTAGLSTGPGPGPEALPMGRTSRPSIAAILTMMADESGDDEIAYLAYRAQQMGN